MDNPLTIQCNKHGENSASVICGHLLNGSKPVGFIENSSIEGDFQAWCFACESLFLKEEEKTEKFKAFNQMTMVCENCYHEIKTKHQSVNFLEEAWEQREESIYPALFGEMPSSIGVLDFSIFKNEFQHEEVDPRWLHFGVFTVKPNSNRDSWIYVTSGMSNPWEAERPAHFSGYGVEFLMEFKEESPWALHALRSLMAYNILLASGKYGEKPMLDYGDKIPHKAQGVTLTIQKAKKFPEFFELISGRVDILEVSSL